MANWERSVLLWPSICQETHPVILLEQEWLAGWALFVIHGLGLEALFVSEFGEWYNRVVEAVCWADLDAHTAWSPDCNYGVIYFEGEATGVIDEASVFIGSLARVTRAVLGCCLLCTPGKECLLRQIYEHRKLWIKYSLHQSINICLSTTGFELELTHARPIRFHRTLLPWLTVFDSSGLRGTSFLIDNTTASLIGMLLLHFIPSLWRYTKSHIAHQGGWGYVRWWALSRDEQVDARDGHFSSRPG